MGSREGGGAGKDWAIAAADESGDVSVPLLTDMTKSSCYYTPKYDSMLVVVRCDAFSTSEASY